MDGCWVPWLDRVAATKFEGIANAVTRDLEAGRLQDGDRLPSQRSIAKALGVDLTTVTRAFKELHRLNVISAEVGRGTCIQWQAVPAATAAVAPRIDLSMNIPPQPKAANIPGQMAEDLHSILRQPFGPLHLNYQATMGSEDDRRLAADWLKPRTGEVPIERVLVTAGAQNALYTILSLCLSAGDSLAVGQFTYPGIRAITAQLRVQLIPVSSDELGLLPDAFADCCQRRPPKALYLVPNMDNPTTATLPVSRRESLVVIARRYGVQIIEDDAYGALEAVPASSFVKLGGDVTWHVSTLAKCLTPALRMAHVIAPEASRALQLNQGLRATNLMAPPLMAALTARWLENGTAKRVCAAIATENEARQQIAIDVLQGAQCQYSRRGPHLWLYLPEPWTGADFAHAVGRVGVAVVASSAFSVSAGQDKWVRISLGLASTHEELHEGLCLVRDLIQSPSDAVIV